MMNKLAFAIQMETDGEQYYLGQAEKSKGSALNHAFLMLSQAEHKHAELLRRRMTAKESLSFNDLSLTDSDNLFTHKADYLRDAEIVPGQLEIYLVALDMEQKSIDLYRGMLADVSDEPTISLLNYLIQQEQKHYDFFDELATLLRKPRDWVEAAEFSPAKEY